MRGLRRRSRAVWGLSGCRGLTTLMFVSRLARGQADACRPATAAEDRARRSTMSTVAKPGADEPSLFGQPNTLVISSRTRDLLDAATAIEMEDAREVGAVGYAARWGAQLSLPYKDPSPDTRLWVRRNGSLTLRVLPGMVGTKGSETAA